MEPCQVAAARAQTKNGCFAFTVHSGYSYLAYATSRSIVIISEHSKTEQLLPYPHGENEIRSIAWNSVTSALTIAFPNSIYHYIPNIISEHGTPVRRWQQIKHLRFPDIEIRQIAWLSRLGQLLICGSTIEIWKFSFNLLSGHGMTAKQRADLAEESPDLLWKTESSNPVYFCSVSPDSRYFVTAGRCDRLPKLWFTFYEESESSLDNPANDPNNDNYDPYKEPEYEFQYRFNYLPHPRAVTSLQWRPGRKQVSVMQNILLTSCVDGLNRLWLELQPFSFSTCAVIQGGTSHVYSWLNYHPFTYDPPDIEDTTCGTEDNLKATLQKSINVSYEAQTQKDQLLALKHQQGERFASVRASKDLDSDWIVGVEKDHLVSFWQLSGINNSLVRNPTPQRKMPELSLWLKTKVSRAQTIPFPRFLIPHCRETSVDREPSRVVLQILNEYGKTCFWDLLISETSEQRTSTARSCFQLLGHSSSVSDMIDHPSEPLIATHSSDNNETILWNVDDTTTLEAPRVLVPVNCLTSASLFTWLASDLFLFYDNEQMHLHKLQEPRKGTRASQHQVSFDSTSPSGDVITIEKLWLLPKSLDTSTTYSFCSIDDNGLTMRFWSLETTRNLSVEATEASFLCKQEIKLSEGQNIQCMDILDPKHYKSIPQNNTNAFHIATGSADGYVQLWRFNAENYQWSKCFQFSAHVSDVSSIKCSDNFHILTLGTASEINLHSARSMSHKEKELSVSCDIRVWERFSEFPEFTMKQVIHLQRDSSSLSATGRAMPLKRRKRSKSKSKELKKPIQGTEAVVRFSVFPLSNGNELLAVSVDQAVYIYTKQLPDDIYGFKLQWKQSSLKFILPTICGSICWRKDGNLLVSASEQLFVFSPWQDIMTQVQDKPGTIIQQANFLSQTPPPFHPKILIQYLVAAKFDAVTKILMRLYDHMIHLVKENEDLDSVHADDLDQPKLLRITLNTQGDTAASLFGGSSGPQVSQASALFSPAFGSSGFQPPAQTFSSASSLFAPPASSIFSPTVEPEPEQQESTENQDDGGSNIQGEDSDIKTIPENKISFDANHAGTLNEILSRVRIVGFSNRDQMFLISVINTFVQMDSLKETLDECGVRFLLFVKLSDLLRKTLQRSIILTPREYIWGMHCEATDTLVNLTLPETANWNTAQALGIGFWLTNPPALREAIKRIAKAEFNANKSAEDCAIFYIALGQKTALMSLFKAVGNRKVAEFLLHDFSEARWKSAATKNAYALLGRHKYRYAAAFFLLAGSIKNAIGICVKHLKDVNLPLVFCRLIEGETGENYRFVLQTHVLPTAESSHDVWLQSASFWLLKDYKESISCLIPESQFEGNNESDPFLGNSFGGSLRSSTDSTNSSRSVDTVASQVSSEGYVSFEAATVHLFRLLSKKPFISSRPPLEHERILIRQCVNGYIQAGCPVLALEELLYLQHIEETLAGEAAKEKELESSSSNFFGGGGSSGFGGFGGGLGSMMIMSEPEPEEEEVKEDTEDTRNSFQKILHPYFIQQALMSHLTRICVPEQIHESAQFANEIGCSVDEDTLCARLTDYCLQQQHYIKLYKMSIANELPVNETAKILREIVSPLYRLIPMMLKRLHSTFLAPSIQIRSVLIRTKQAYSCLIDFHQKLDDDEVNYLVNGIFIGYFFVSWFTTNVPALLALLSLENVSFPFPSEIVDALDGLLKFSLANTQEAFIQQQRIELGERQDGREAQRFLVIFLRALLARAFHKIKESSECHEFTPEMKEMMEEFNFRVRVTPFLHVVASSDLPLSLLSPKQSLKELFGSLMKVSSFGDDIEGKQLFNTLFRLVGKDLMIQANSFSDKIRRAILPQSLNSGGFVKFTDGDEICLFRDKDLIQSFCVHPLDPSHIIVANTKEIREIEVSIEGKSAQKKHLAVMASVEILKNRKARTAPQASKLPGSNSAPSMKRQLSSSGSGIRTPGSRRARDVLPEHSNAGVSYLVSHPKEPYYLSGNGSGELHLWLFHHAEALLKYKTSNTAISKIHFNESGTKFGCCDGDGNVSLFRFLPNVDSNQALPFWNFLVHNKRCGDFTFLNTGSWIATAGHSKNRRNVCIWDVLLAPNRSLVASFVCHEDGANSICYSREHRLLISGGKTGDICLIDMRTMKKRREVSKAHNANIQTICLGQYEKLLFTGSTDGNIKCWSLPDLDCLHTWTDAHEQHRFVRPEMLINPGAAVFTKGVMHVYSPNNQLYSCGADGRLTERTFAR